MKIICFIFILVRVLICHSYGDITILLVSFEVHAYYIFVHVIYLFGFACRHTYISLQKTEIIIQTITLRLHMIRTTSLVPQCFVTFRNYHVSYVVVVHLHLHSLKIVIMNGLSLYLHFSLFLLFIDTGFMTFGAIFLAELLFIAGAISKSG